ncbi:MAG: UDP-3-O-(3-hydroxymyristoyl)glucosamine N-acyltransferase [Bacteroidota bacterium]
MNQTIAQIAKLLNAQVEGNDSINIHSIAKIEEADTGQITFLANSKYTPYIYSTRASAVIVSKDFKPENNISATLLKVEEPYKSFAVLMHLLSKEMEKDRRGIEEPSFISDRVKLGHNVYIGAFSYLGEGVELGDHVKIYPHVYIGDNVVIESGSIIYPHVTIYSECKIGKQCIVHSGARIGSDGFGFAPMPDGSFKKIPQLGNVIMGNQVEVGANTTVDRATLGSTYIENGVKLDNLVQVAHNVRIGQDSALAAQCGISGSTKIGRNVIVGGQVGVIGHLEIADQTQIAAKSGVNKSIKEPQKKWKGIPIQPFQSQIRSEVLYRKLNEMYQRIQELENKLEKKS